jgi:hypothetical protein
VSATNNNNPNGGINMILDRSQPEPARLLTLAITLCAPRYDVLDDVGRIVSSANGRTLLAGCRTLSRRARLLSLVLGFECDGRHIPPEAEAITQLDGLTFVVTKSHARPGVNTSRHRTFVVCPVCGRTVPMGRIHQHAPVHRDLLEA